MLDIRISQIKEVAVRSADGTHRQSFVFYYTDNDGKERRVYSNSKEKLALKRQKKYADLLQGVEKKTKMVWDELAVEFLKYRSKQINVSISDTHYENDERHLRLHLTPHFTGQNVANIKTLDVNMLLLNLQAKKLSPKSQRHVVNTGLRVMRYAKAAEYAKDNPFEGTEREKITGRNGTRGGYDHEQIEGILNTEKDVMYKAVWYMATFTGLAASELIGLQWDDIDLQRGSVTVKRSAVRYRYNENAKTEFRKRTLAIPPRTLTWLKEWKIGCPHPLIVFPSATDTLASPDTWRKHLKYTCKRAGVEYKGIGGFRNYFCTSMENAGVPNAIRNYRMGHSKKSETADIHYTDVDLRKATSGKDALALEAQFSP